MPLWKHRRYTALFNSLQILPGASFPTFECLHNLPESFPTLPTLLLNRQTQHKYMYPSFGTRLRFQRCQTCSFMIKLQYASNNKNYHTKNMLGNYLFVIIQLSILVCTFSLKHYFVIPPLLSCMLICYSLYVMYMT